MTFSYKKGNRDSRNRESVVRRGRRTPETARWFGLWHFEAFLCIIRREPLFFGVMVTWLEAFCFSMGFGITFKVSLMLQLCLGRL